jgi:hypothetical protein
MPSSSSSAATTPTAEASSEDTSSNAAAELHPGGTVEFGVSRISSVRVQDMQQLGGGGGSRARGRVGHFRGIFHRWPSPTCTSICVRGPAEICSLGPPADT